MPLTNDCKTRIQEVVKEILSSRLDKFPSDSSANRNAPFHDAFLGAFREQLSEVNLETPYLVALASWMHGLNTSLGSGFENIAHILSNGYKRKFTNAFTLKISNTQATNINSIIVGLKSGNRLPNLQEEDHLITSGIQDTDILEDALSFTADNYVETADYVEAIELKSVRPNSGEGRGEKQKILNGKAALKRMYPQKQVRFYIAFPFDPTSHTPTGYDKTRFMNHLIEFKKFFSPEEILIASEFWDHLSGELNTMDQLLEIVAETVNMFCRHE
ncbi:MAG: TdeIII family type II restriction endonuclease [Pyrinomonadaceae bacterium]